MQTSIENPLSRHLADWLLGRVGFLDFERFRGATAEIALPLSPPLLVQCVMPVGEQRPKLLDEYQLSNAWLTVGKGMEYHLVCEMTTPSEGKIFTRQSLRNPITNDVCCFSPLVAASYSELLRGYFAPPIRTLEEGAVSLSITHAASFSAVQLVDAVTRHLQANAATYPCIFSDRPEVLAHLYAAQSVSSILRAPLLYKQCKRT